MMCPCAAAAIALDPLRPAVLIRVSQCNCYATCYSLLRSPPLQPPRPSWPAPACTGSRAIYRSTMPPKPLKRKVPGPGLEPSPKKKKFAITFTKCDPTLAFTDAKKPRPQRFDPVAPHIWRDKIQEGCKTAFARLEMRDDPSVRDAILRRIEAGRDTDTLRHSAP